MLKVIVPPEYRTDCKERFDAIRRSYDFTGKTVIDIGCANGYFLARCLEEGAKDVVGVEPDEQYKQPFIVRDIKQVNTSRKWDVCFYLDLHYHNGIDYFPWIKKNVKLLFVAASGSGNNSRLQDDLMREFSNHEFVINTAYANRNTYRVRASA